MRGPLTFFVFSPVWVPLALLHSEALTPSYPARHLPQASLKEARLFSQQHPSNSCAHVHTQRLSRLGTRLGAPNPATPPGGLLCLPQLSPNSANHPQHPLSGEGKKAFFNLPLPPTPCQDIRQLNSPAPVSFR